MIMKVCIIWQYQPKKVQIKITNSQFQKYPILATIILFLIYLSLISHLTKRVLKGKTWIMLHLRIGIRKSWKLMMNLMKTRIKSCKINHFLRILKSSHNKHLMHKFKWKKILIMRILPKNLTKWYWIFEQRRYRNSLKLKEEWITKKNRQ